MSGGGGPPLRPLPTAIVLAAWSVSLVVIAFVVVPALFGLCRGPA